jgi:dinuclear metal center YbgI/SA1388 family protein
MKRVELQNCLEALFESHRFKDYCPNGLQVEGRPEVHRVVCGVTASLALIDSAIARNADAIVVHHGWFWRGEDPRVLAIRKQRLARLLAHDINLFAYHLPLDAHPELGNNVQLARVLGWVPGACLPQQPLVMLGQLAQTMSAGEVARSVAARLAREPLLVGDPAKRIQSVAWCTGGGQGYFEDAIASGVDLFLSGEASEQTVHLARESGIPFLAAGHHATERYGIRALSDHLLQLGLSAEFIDHDNPV